MASLKRFGQLKPHHIDFLCSSQTLQHQVGFNLEQRAILFHRQFPECKITRNQLWYIYHKNGIRRKVVRNTKVLTPKQVTRLEPKVDELRTNLRTSIDKGRSIIYIDEVMFETSSVLRMEYSRKFENILVDY